MTQMHAFSPLRKQPGYPTTSVKLTIGDVRYDLFLPEEVSDELLVHFVGSEDSYRQVAKYCNAEGIDAIRARPSLLDHEFRDGKPTYAITFYPDEDASGNDASNEWVALRLVVGPYAARQLYNRACKRESITEKLADIVSHSEYFKHCWGFELLLLHCEDFEDRYPLTPDIDAAEPASFLLKEPKTTKTRFSDMEISLL